MKEEQIKEIISLKDKGISYKWIAVLLSINESTIKTIYSRYRSEDKGIYCLYCSKKLRQTKGHRQKKFCSSKCKDAFYNAKRSYYVKWWNRVFKCDESC